MADKDTATDLTSFKCLSGETPHDSWDDLVNKGVDIAVCPGCAKIGGITPDTLRKGAFTQVVRLKPYESSWRRIR